MRDQPQPSKLGRAAAAPVEPSKFVKATLGARVLEPWRIPRLDLDVTITLVPHWRASMIEADVIEQLERKLKIELNASTEMEYEAERAAQFCADAFLDPESVKKEEYAPIGTLADWRNLDREVLAECWRQYAAVRVAYDPVSLVLGDDEIEAIEDAIKKKRRIRPARWPYCAFTVSGVCRAICCIRPTVSFPHRHRSLRLGNHQRIHPARNTTAR